MDSAAEEYKAAHEENREHYICRLQEICISPTAQHIWGNFGRMKASNIKKLPRPPVMPLSIINCKQSILSSCHGRYSVQII